MHVLTWIVPPVAPYLTPLRTSLSWAWSYARSQSALLPCLVLGLQAPAWPHWLFTWVMRSKLRSSQLCSESSYPLGHLSSPHLPTLEVLWRSSYHDVSMIGKKGMHSWLAGSWSRLTQVKWIILSQLQLSNFKSQVEGIRRNQFQQATTTRTNIPQWCTKHLPSELCLP